MSCESFAHKITTDHLRRDAYLYVRQSSLRQVLENSESTQRILALRALAVLQYLAQAGLPHVQIRIAAQMISGDFVGEALTRHDSPPAGIATPCWPTAAPGPDRLAPIR